MQGVRQATPLVLRPTALPGLCSEGNGPVNHRTAYKPDKPQSQYHDNITLGGKLLCRNQEVTLERGIGYPAGRYAFQYAEERPDGQWVLMFFGPTRRSKQRYREVWQHRTDEVRVIHRPRLRTAFALADAEDSFVDSL